MKFGPFSARRLVAGTFLFGALIMLALGLTFFSSHLKGVTFILFWLVCFLLTGLSAILAVIDVALIRRELKKEQRALIESTLAAAQADRVKNLTTENEPRHSD